MRVWLSVHWSPKPARLGLREPVGYRNRPAKVARGPLPRWEISMSRYNVTEHGIYAGKVVQEYNTCNGFTFAHFHGRGTSRPSTGTTP